MLDSGGYIRPAAVMEIAEALTADMPGSVADAVLHLFAPVRARAVRGELARLRITEGGGVVQVTLVDDTGAALAQVIETRIALAEQPAAPEPAAPRLVAVPDGATGTAEARRRRILDAASHVIARHGFANATTKKIAAAAGLHVPTMYQYVRSKDELLLLIFDDCLDKLAIGLEQAAAGPGTPDQRLRRAVDWLVQGSELHREQIRLISREAASLPPPMRSKVHRRWDAHLGHIRQIITDGVASGIFAPVDPDLTAHLIESLCETWSLRRFAMRRHGLAKVAALIQQILASGLRPVPGTTA